MKRTASTPQQTTIEVAPLSLLAALQPSTINAEARTVDVVFYAGGPIPWIEPRTYERCTIVLSLEAGAARLDRLNSGGPLLDTHNSYELEAVIGVVEEGSARIQKGQAVATVRFAKDDELADRVWNKVQQRIVRNVSVGARIYKYEVTEATDTQPMQCRAIDWEPAEISAVPIGADPGAKIRAAADNVAMNTCVVVHAKEPIMGEEIRTETPATVPAATAAATPAPAATTTPSATPAPAAAAATVDVEAAQQRALGEDRQRGAAILALAEIPAVKASGRFDTAFFRGHVEKGTPLATVREAVLEQLAQASAAIPVDSRVPATVTADARDRWQQGASAWLLMRAGMTDKIAAAAKTPRFGHHFQAVATDPGEFRGFSLLDLAKDALERRGVSTRGMDKMTAVWRAMREPGSAQAAGGLATRSEFAVLLENVMHKTILAAYGIAPDTWRLFCGVGTVTDFRAHNRYRWGSLGALEKLTEHGEFRVKSIPDGEKESIAADTRGNIIGITRKAIVDDDMSVFDGLAQALGRASALSIEIDVYATLALNSGLGPLMNDGTAMFDDTAHKNVSTTAAITVAALDADRVKLGSQKDLSGNEVLDLRPAVLLLSQSLGGTARVLNEAEFDTDAVTTNATNKFMVPNRVRGLFRTIVDSPRLTGTRRYIFVDPVSHPVLQVVFLDGQQEPVIESWDPREFDGLRWRARFDYGVGGVDFRGAVTNAG